MRLESVGALGDDVRGRHADRDFTMIGPADIEAVAEAARDIQPAKGNYIEEDFVMNLQETVLDYQMSTTAVVRALQHYRDNRWDEIRTGDDLEQAMSRFTEDKQGNITLAQHLWGYKHVDQGAAAARPDRLLPEDRRHRPSKPQAVGEDERLQA